MPPQQLGGSKPWASPRGLCATPHKLWGESRGRCPGVQGTRRSHPGFPRLQPKSSARSSAEPDTQNGGSGAGCEPAASYRGAACCVQVLAGHQPGAGQAPVQPGEPPLQEAPASRPLPAHILPRQEGGAPRPEEGRPQPRRAHEWARPRGQRPEPVPRRRPADSTARGNAPAARSTLRLRDTR